MRIVPDSMSNPPHDTSLATTEPMISLGLIYRYSYCFCKDALFFAPEEITICPWSSNKSKPMILSKSDNFTLTFFDDKCTVMVLQNIETISSFDAPKAESRNAEWIFFLRFILKNKEFLVSNSKSIQLPLYGIIEALYELTPA